MTVKLTSNFLANARGLTFLDSAGVTWSFNQTTNELSAAASGGGGAGTVTSVGYSVNTTYLTLGGTTSPITTSGAFTLDLSTSAKANLALAATALQSVSLTDASTTPIFTTSGSGALTETLKTQSANTVFAGPSTGSAAQPAFRALVTADLPSFVAQNNITPDSHPSIPTGVGLGPNDEFEFGTSIDLTGARYSGATAWSNFNISTSTNTVTQGGLVLNPVNTVANTVNGFSQPIVGTTWQYDCKASAITFNPSAMGMFIATSGLKMLYLNVFINGASSLVEVQAYTNPTTFSSTLANFSFGSPGLQTWVYMRISFNGTNIFLQFSTTGHNGSYKTLLTTTAAAFLGGSPTLVGLASNLQNSTQYQAVWDWFRQTA